MPASPKSQSQPFTVPELVVEASVNAIVGQAELLELKLAVQVKQVIDTVFWIVSEQFVLVPMIKVTV